MAIDTSYINSIDNLPASLFYTAQQSGTQPAQWYRVQGEYVPITYTELADRIRHVAAALIRAGIQAGDRVAILMENRPEWAVVDFAILSIGAVTVPLYCSYRQQDMVYVLNDCAAVAVFTSNHALLDDVLAVLESCPHIQHIYAIENSAEHQSVTTLAELEATDMGDAEVTLLSQRLAGIERDTLATLVYTSGTTAEPKGVMLTHGNILANLEAIPTIIQFQHDDKMLSFLPLAHVLERTGGHFLAYAYGISVAFAERSETVAKNLTEARPSIMIAVPRMLELVRSRILSQVAQQPAVKQWMFHRFLSLAQQTHLGLLDGLMLRLLDRIIGAKVRQRFGGSMSLMISGGAPLSVEVGAFFEALGLPVVEGYGLTESAPLLTANPSADRRLGTVGKIVPGVEIRIANDGEILARGANIMSGYWHNPAATQATIIDGWLHTGDIGVLSTDGYLSITDRKKDMIVNSGGENIAPQRIESLLVVDDNIDQALVYGDRKTYLVALIVPNEEVCRAWAKTQGLVSADWAELCASEVLNKYLQHRITQRLKGLNGFEKVRRITLLAESFSIESGLLTPTLKIKRRKVYAHYNDILEALY